MTIGALHCAKCGYSIAAVRTGVGTQGALFTLTYITENLFHVIPAKSKAVNVCEHIRIPSSHETLAADLPRFKSSS